MFLPMFRARWTLTHVNDKDGYDMAVVYRFANAAGSTARIDPAQ